MKRYINIHTRRGFCNRKSLLSSVQYKCVKLDPSVATFDVFQFDPPGGTPVVASYAHRHVPSGTTDEPTHSSGVVESAGN